LAQEKPLEKVEKVQRSQPLKNRPQKWNLENHIGGIETYAPKRLLRKLTPDIEYQRKVRDDPISERELKYKYLLSKYKVY